MARDATDSLTERELSLFEKARKIITTAEPKHKATTERWLSLMNRELHRGGFTWSIAGKSTAVKHHFTAKFGIFCPRDEPVACIDR